MAEKEKPGEATGGPSQSEREGQLTKELIRKLHYLTNQGHQEEVMAVLTNLSSDILQTLIDAKSSSQISILHGCKVYVDGVLEPTSYASLRSKIKMNIPSFLSNVDWKTIMGALRNQTDHVVCWSIVISELIRAIRLICQRETDENILYSPQDMIDFVDPQMRRTTREDHYCYPNSLKNGLNYVRDNGIQREEDRPFIGCSADQPDSYRNPANLTFTKRHKTALSIDQMFGALKEGPIGASLAIFQPEFRKRAKEMYRGAESPSSRLVSSHSVSIAAVGEENGERFAWVRSSEGDKVGHSGY
ncbi:unnamed protein product [Arabis nemorensis]|uniref:Peptidase C1A papain C-terminal domain-containing protein n=1 Tax=Arabis nemorensis TaxID=586526 RepID=A0A565BEX8_9BRAS|nr:unnamed protein product [Arabis nemorensis]